MQEADGKFLAMLRNKSTGPLVVDAWARSEWADRNKDRKSPVGLRPILQILVYSGLSFLGARRKPYNGLEIAEMNLQWILIPSVT